MSNTRSLIIGIFAVIVLIVGAVVLIRYLRSNRENNTPDVKSTTSANITGVTSGNSVNLSGFNRSDESGNAILEEIDSKLRITLSLEKYPVDALQPANIIMGTCKEPGSVLYPLASLYNGQSVTTLETTKPRLISQKPLIIAIAKSDKNGDFASCGSL